MVARTPPPRDAASDRPADLRRALRQVAAVLAEVQRGRGSWAGQVMLDDGGGTALKDSRLAPDSIVVPDLMDPDALSWAVSCALADRGQGEWLLSHDAGGPGRVWRFLVLA